MQGYVHNNTYPAYLTRPADATQCNTTHLVQPDAIPADCTTVFNTGICGTNISYDSTACSSPIFSGGNKVTQLSCTVLHVKQREAITCNQVGPKFASYVCMASNLHTCTVQLAPIKCTQTIQYNGFTYQTYSGGVATGKFGDGLHTMVCR